MAYPRVTEILNPFTSYDKVPPNILERAAARGTTVHALCAGLAKDEWIPDGMIGEEYLGYVKSFKQWAKHQVKKFVIIEKRYHDDFRGYSGQLDFVVQGNDGELYLVDLKTSAAPQKTYPIQMAAYDNLLRQHQVKVKGAMLVYLDKDGEFPEIDYIEDFNEQWSVFCSALHCWNYFKRTKKHDKPKRHDEIDAADGREDSSYTTETSSGT